MTGSRGESVTVYLSLISCARLALLVWHVPAMESLAFLGFTTEVKKHTSRKCEF